MAWWEKMPKPLQAWLTIGGILVGLVGSAFALGASSSGAVGELRTLPLRVHAVEQRVDVMEADMAETRCYVRAFALKRDPLSDCAPMLAERRP